MKYGELVEFDPIEDIVRLREADDKRGRAPCPTMCVGRLAEKMLRLIHAS